MDYLGFFWTVGHTKYLKAASWLKIAMGDLSLLFWLNVVKVIDN